MLHAIICSIITRGGREVGLYQLINMVTHCLDKLIIKEENYFILRLSSAFIAAMTDYYFI